jgi:hypothetical protein
VCIYIYIWCTREKRAGAPVEKLCTWKTSRDLSSRFTSATSQTPARLLTHRFFPLCRTLFSISLFLSPPSYTFTNPLSLSFTHPHTSTHVHTRIHFHAHRYITENRGVLPAGSRQEQFASLPNTPPINYQRHRACTRFRRAEAPRVPPYEVAHRHSRTPEESRVKSGLGIRSSNNPLSLSFSLSLATETSLTLLIYVVYRWP